MDVATLGISVNFQDVEKAAKSLDTFAAAGKKADQPAPVVADWIKKINQAASAGDAAKNYVAGLERQFQLAQARIKDGILRGFLTPQQAREAGREAALEYNRGLTQALDRGAAGGAFRGGAGQDLF